MSPLTEAQHVTILRRFGGAAFLFFFAKGVLWLAAPFIFLWFA